MRTPMPTSGVLDFTKDDAPVDQKVYRSMIGSFLYLWASHPDIVLSVCMCARYQAALKECHLLDVKRIVRYLIHTQNFGIWYPKGSYFDIVDYSDSDYARAKVDRNPPRVHVNFLGDLLSLGHPRNKTRYPYQLPKRNTLLLDHVVFNYYGCLRRLRIMLFMFKSTFVV